jgi:hypothetical protein
MRNTKLIFIEGLPGLGKTTTSSVVASWLQSRHFTVNLFLETQPEHPLNVGGDLHPAGNTPGEAFFQRYTPVNFVQESIKRWEQFVHAALQSETISVLDSFPYQNSIRILLQMDATFDFMREYANHVETLVMPLIPTLIYFNQPDDSHAINHIKNISAKRGKEWTVYVEELVSNCPYGVARNLEGFNGIVTFISDYKQIMDSLLHQSRIPRIILESRSENWDACYRQIETFLELS